MLVTADFFPLNDKFTHFQINNILSLQVVAWFIIITNLGLATLTVGVALVSKGGSTILEKCRGRYELFYFFDYFYEGGFPISYFTQFCFHSSFYCQFFRFIVLLLATNIIDMILLVKIVMEMKSQTTSVSDLLSSKALNERKR